MNNTGKALLWAAIMIGAAIASRFTDLSDGARFGSIAGLSGAAWGSLHGDTACGRGCVQ